MTTADRPGLVTLFGSGETSRSGRTVCDWVLSHLTHPIPLAVLETPAGFQPNSALVAERVAEFFRTRLQNHHPQVTVVPARRRATPFSPDDPDVVAPLLRATAIFLGPGSPTYAVRQLKGSLAWEYLLARHRLGAALILASAATIAASTFVLPVYEIYKAGADLHWCAGLDIFGPYGLSLALVPHWDNREGGAELDTSRCYMGRDRFRQLLALLPPEVTVVGIDEHTALVVDLGSGVCRTIGRGGVSLLRQGEETRFTNGQTFPASDLGPLRKLAPDEGLRPEVWRAAVTSQQEGEAPEKPTQEVLTRLEARELARARGDWATADYLREEIAVRGWRVLDTPNGPVLEPLPEARP